jgi:hypothetical protein
LGVDEMQRDGFVQEANYKTERVGERELSSVQPLEKW